MRKLWGTSGVSRGNAGKGQRPSWVPTSEYNQTVARQPRVVRCFVPGHRRCQRTALIAGKDFGERIVEQSVWAGGLAGPLGGCPPSSSRHRVQLIILIGFHVANLVVAPPTCH